MEVLHATLMIFLRASSTFMAMAAAILLFHCFYDTNFRWSWKKCIVLLVVSLIDAILYKYFPVLAYLPGRDLYLDASWFLLPIAAIYDYTGKKSVGFIRYIAAFYILTLWSNGIARFGYSLIFPNENVGFLSLLPDFLSFENLPALNALSTQEALEKLLAAIDYFKQYQPVISDTMKLVNMVFNTLFFGFVFIYLFFRLYKHGIVIKLGKRTLIIAIGYLLLCNLFLYFFLFFGLQSEITSCILYALSVFLAVLIPLFACNAHIGEHHRKRTEAQEQHIQAELAHFQQYRHAQEETARFRHDIRNNLLCINDMLQQGKTDEASEYLKDLLAIVDHASRKYVTGDDLLDSIVGVKTQIMEQQGIRFELDGVLAGGLAWKPMDICNVFANALDNAIEACRKVAPEKRYISMIIKSTSQFWFITIANPVTAAIDTAKLFQRNGGYTSKSDSAKHGIGTYNMKHTVEANGAMLKAECTDETFRLEIMIDKSSYNQG